MHEIYHFEFMRNFIFILLAMLIQESMKGQTISPSWISNFVRPGQQCFTLDIVADSNGNSYIMEVTYDTMLPMQYAYTTYILKYDQNGQLQWDVPLPTEGFPTTPKMKLSLDGNIYVGKRDSLSFEVTKITPNGFVVWSRQFLTYCEVINDMVTDDSSYIYLIGTTWDLDQALIVKIHTSGNQVWYRSYNFQPAPYHYDRGKAIVVDRVGHVYCAIASQDSANSNWYRTTLLRYSCTGQLEWVQGYSSNQDGDVPTHLRLYNDTMLIVIGYQSPVQGQSDILTQRYDTSGNLIWTIVVNADSLLGNTGNRFDYPVDVVITNSGNIAVVGECANSGMPLWMEMFYDKNGNLLWWKQDFGSSAEPITVVEDIDGHLIFAGNTGYTATVQSRMGVTKYDTLGNLLWSDTYSTATYGSYHFCSATVDSSGNILLTGANSILNISTVVTIKYSNVVSIPESDDFVGVKVFPNPASSTVAFEFENMDEDRKITMFCSSGREVLSVAAPQISNEISLAGLAKGIYFYKIEDEKSTYGKIVIQ